MNPSIHEQAYKFCPTCRTDLQRKSIDGQTLLSCPNCGFIFWNNPKPVVSIILGQNGQVLLLQRANEPLKGFWCLPGGYINYAETPEQAVAREANEEIGVEVTIDRLVGVYRIDNDPRGVNIDIIYTGRLIGPLSLSAEHQQSRFFDPNDLPADVAYKHKEAITDWKKSTSEIMNTAQPQLIIITGPPGAGKTTLGQKLASELKLPFAHKDGIKEVLFDSLGYADNEDRAKNIQAASYNLLYRLTAILGQAGKSLIIESNFLNEIDTPKIAKLAADYGFRIVQIFCQADTNILFERFQQRTKTGERHLGHKDHQKLDEFKQALLDGREYKLALEGRLIELDMNDFSVIDYAKLIEQLRP